MTKSRTWQSNPIFIKGKVPKDQLINVEIHIFWTKNKKLSYTSPVQWLVQHSCSGNLKTFVHYFNAFYLILLQQQFPKITLKAISKIYTSLFSFSESYLFSYFSSKIYFYTERTGVFREAKKRTNKIKNCTAGFPTNQKFVVIFNHSIGSTKFIIRRWTVVVEDSRHNSFQFQERNRSTRIRPASTVVLPTSKANKLLPNFQATPFYSH